MDHATFLLREAIALPSFKTHLLCGRACSWFGQPGYLLRDCPSPLPSQVPRIYYQALIITLSSTMPVPIVVIGEVEALIDTGAEHIALQSCHVPYTELSPWKNSPLGGLGGLIHPTRCLKLQLRTTAGVVDIDVAPHLPGQRTSFLGPTSSCQRMHQWSAAGL